MANPEPEASNLEVWEKQVAYTKEEIRKLDEDPVNYIVELDPALEAASSAAVANHCATRKIPPPPPGMDSTTWARMLDQIDQNDKLIQLLNQDIRLKDEIIVRMEKRLNHKLQLRAKAARVNAARKRRMKKENP